MFEYHTHTLPSGLRIAYQHNDSPVGFCGLMVDCGTRNETDPTQFGMAHFIEHILFKGTTKRDAWHINQRMESVGGELNAFTTKEDTTFYCTFLANDFARACELLFDLVFNATAPSHELEKEQEVVVDEIESYRDNPAELIYDLFENQLFEGSPLGHNILGSAETVRSFDHDSCIDFIRRNYTPDRMVFFYYGSLKLERVLREVNKYEVLRNDTLRYDTPSATIRTSSYDNKPLPPYEGGQGVGPEGPGGQGVGPEGPEGLHHQSHCMLGCLSYPIGHPNATALALINNILGGPGMNSRLNQQLREKRGLVYTVESSITTFTDTGYFSIYFGCDHEDRDLCLRLCRKELHRLIDEPLSPRQLLAAQKQFKGQLGINTANLENNALALAKNILRRGHLLSLEEIYERIDAVTSEQIQQVATELFAEDQLHTIILK